MSSPDEAVREIESEISYLVNRIAAHEILINQLEQEQKPWEAQVKFLKAKIKDIRKYEKNNS